MKLQISAAMCRWLMLHASVIRMRDSDGRAVGIFIGIGDDRNRSFTVLGREQTNNRAGLLAAIAVMRVHEFLDSLQGERQLNNEGNADLWDEFVTELRLKTMRQEFTSTGRSLPLWTKGDMMLQTATSAAAAHHAAPQALAGAATKRQRVALSTRMFVADLFFFKST